MNLGPMERRGLQRLSGLTLPAIATGLYLTYADLLNAIWGGIALWSMQQAFSWLHLMKRERLGIKLLHAEKYTNALSAFRMAKAYWTKRNTLDRLRGPVVGNIVQFPYIAYARHNEIYCLILLKQLEEAELLLQSLEADYPAMPQPKQLRLLLRNT